MLSFMVYQMKTKLVHLVKHKWKDLSVFIEKVLVKRTEILYNCE